MFDEGSPYALVKSANRDLSLSEYRSGQTALQSLPRALFIELTQGCNLACPMCRSEMITPASRRMTRQLFDRIAQTLFPTAELIDLRGWGETLILPEAVDRIECAKSYGAKLRIVTNLSFRRDEVLDALARADAMIDISLDTSDAELLRLVRGGANLEMISRNVSYLVRRFGHAHNLAFLATVQRLTIPSLPALVEHAAALGVPEIRLFSVTVEEGSPLDIEEKASELDEAVRQLSLTGKALGVRVLAGTRLGSMPRNAIDILPCIHPWAYCNISYSGEVGFCDHLIGPGNAEFVVGDLETSDFGSIWNGEKMQRIRREHFGARRPGASQFAHCAWCYKNKHVDFEQKFDSDMERYVVRLS